MLEVKKLSLGDLEIVQKLAIVTWNETYTSILSKEQLDFMLNEIYSKESLEKQMASGQTFFGFYENQEMVGFSAGTLMENQVFKLNKIYLLAQCKGKGYGGFMIKYMENFAKSIGANLLILNVNKFNPTLKFYEKQGYTIDEEEDIPIGEYWMNDYVMKKVL